MAACHTGNCTEAKRKNFEPFWSAQAKLADFAEVKLDDLGDVTQSRLVGNATRLTIRPPAMSVPALEKRSIRASSAGRRIESAQRRALRGSRLIFFYSFASPLAVPCIS
jgi:hypothetical protein